MRTRCRRKRRGAGRRPARLKIRDMAARMPGHVEDIEFEMRRRKPNPIAPAERVGDNGNRFRGGPVDGNTGIAYERGDAADMVGMMVRE